MIISPAFALDWIKEHPHTVLDIAATHFEGGYPDEVIKLAREQPVLFYRIAQDHARFNTGKVRHIIDYFTKESKISVIIGDRRSGKTAFAFYLAEHIQEKRETRWVGRPRKLPDFIKPVKTIMDVPAGAVAFVDEASISANARDHSSKTNVNLSKLLAILGHKDITVIFITQSSALVDLNIIRLADSIIFRKMNTQAQDLDRAFVQNLPEFIMPSNKTVSLFVSDDFFRRVKTPLPSFWGEKYSKPYRKLNEKQAEDFIDTMYSLGYSVPEIVEELAMSDYQIDEFTLYKKYTAQLTKEGHDPLTIMGTLSGQQPKLTEKMIRGWAGAEA
ncbi:MAG: ATP-binding protein [Gammaproteobacteria bacterium]|nr:ATP-binding protein [Gammaproteobacteria bacterium]